MPTQRQQKRLEVQRQIVKHFDEKIPAFTDIFDEKTFYIFFGCVTILAFAIAIMLSYCCQLKLDDADELRKQREKKERKRREKLALRLLNEQINNAKPDSDEYKDLKKKLEILENKIKDAKKNKTKSFLDDTDYEFSDEEEILSQTSDKTSTTTLKSE